MSNRTIIRSLLTVMLCFGGVGCAAGFGAKAGVEINTEGDATLWARGWSRAGARTSNNPGSEDAESESGFFWLPQLEAGMGWTLTRGGPAFSVGMPFLGGVYVPNEEGWPMSVQLTPRMVFELPLDASVVFVPGVSVAFGVARSLKFTEEASERPEWPPLRTHHTAGGVVEAGIGWVIDGEDNGEGRPVGVFFVGPSYEYLSFFSMGL